jgi:hypothetical protein
MRAVGQATGANWHEVSRALLRVWDACWFSRFDPLSVGVFRICLGALITLFYVALFPNWERFYGTDGIRSLQDVPGPDPWTVFYWTESVFPIRIWWWFAFIAAVLFTVGLKTRVWTIALFVLECSLLGRSPQAMNGEDVVFRMLLFWGMFAPLGAQLSLDRWLSNRSEGASTEEMPEVWPVRAMQINFVLIYAISLPNKLADDVAWWSGDAVYLAVVSNMWGRWPWPEMFYLWDGLISKIFTYGTLVVEAAIPLAIWFRRTRLIVIFGAALLHIGIGAMLNGVSFFSLAMVCGLWIFVPAETSRKLLRSLA